MLGPFATASRRTPIQQEVSLLSHARIDVHDNNNDNNDNAWHRGPLWPDRMGPIIIRLHRSLSPPAWLYDVTVNKSYSGCYDKNAADESETKTDNDKIKITIFLRVGHATRLTRVIYEQQQSCLKTLTRPLTVHWRRTRREREREH